MAKQLNINLAFTADTGKAKAQLQDLQRQLDSLMKKSVTKTDGLGLTKDLMKATEAAGELKTMLEAATTPTGKLDLGAFNQAIQKSNRKLSDYAADLNSLGPEGQKAFANIAKAISTAEMPLRRTNNLLSEFAVTLKNTARWQISSSILHGFMGSVQSAYGYAQDLNKSLNDIRIVTNQNADQMAEFAANANKAAKALSTTTTAYTNAALIYYQQGDDDTTVLEKTDVTTKMANITGQEASVVSDQLTAIWNNFNKTGEESYEKYADILTALGAATASSTDEIAGGLEKFASIADMIGLSYEYAASALATITATTRQSEDVVGTALKTIFARIQGLNLGETLEDGTTLNKYSEALEKVGISIFKQNGELKDMNSILDEMGSKWKTLSEDQQVALAQTVAGVRQYNQLVSLMENWDYFGENLAIAKGAEGELDRQAEIYAESWEAARKRVQASAQSIYQALIDEDFFIGLSNTFADLLSVIKGTIDGLGGLPGVLTLISSLMLQSFGPEIADSINNTFYNLTYNTQTARDELRKLREDAAAAMASLGDDSIAGSAAIDVFKKQSELQDTLLTKTHELEKAGKSLSDEEAKRAQQLMDITDHIGQQILKAAELRQEEESITKTITDRITQESLGKVENLDEKIKNVKNLQTTYTALGPIISSCRDEIDKLGNSATEEQKARMLELVKEAFKRLKESVDIAGISFDGLTEESQALLSSLLGFDDIDSFDVLKAKLGDMDDAVQGLGVDAQKAFISLKNELLKVDGVDKQGIKKLLDDLKTSLSTTGRLTAEQIQQFKNFGIAVDETGNIIEGFKGKVLTFADGMVALGQVLSSFASVITSIKGLSEIWTNEDLTTGEKILRTLTTLGMLLPTLTRLFDAQNLAKLAALKIDKEQIKTTIIKIAGLNAETVAAQGLTAALWKKVAAYMAAHWQVLAIVAAMTVAVGVIVAVTNAYNEEANAAKRASEAANNLSNSAKDAQNSVNDLLSTFDSYDSAIDKLEECAEKLDVTAESTENWQNALNDVNDQIWNILEKYPELAKMPDIFKNDGTLNRDVVDSYIAQQKNKADNARASALSAKARASQLQVKSDATNLRRGMSDVIANNTYDAGDNGSIYAKNQAQASEMFNGLYELAKQENFNAEEFNAAVDDYIAGFEMTTGSFEDELRDAANDIKDLGKAAQAADTQMENVGKLLAKQVLGANATEEQVNSYSSNYSEAEEKAYDEAIKATKNGIDIWSGKDDAELQALWERYSKATGTNYQLSSNAVQGDDLNRSFEYINEEGIKVVISAEELAAAIASSEAQAQAQTSSREELFKYNSENANLAFLNGEISEAVDTSLLNDLAQIMDLSDDATRQAIDAQLNMGQTAAEQTKIIEDMLSKMTAEEQELAEIAQLKADAVENYDLDADVIEIQAKAFQKLYEAEKLTAKQATQLAIENQRMNNGVADLVKNWKDWNKELKAGKLDPNKKATSDYAKVIKDLTKTIADLTGASADLELPDEFFDEGEGNLELLEKAAKGSEQAINELGIAVAKAQLDQFEIEELKVDGEIINQGAINNFTTNKEIIKQGLTEIQEAIQSGQDLTGQGLNEILANSTVGSESWITALNEMAVATKMTTEEMNSLLNSMGLEADVKLEAKEVTSKKPVTRTRIINRNPVIGENGQTIGEEYDTVTSVVDHVDVTETLMIPQINVNGGTDNQSSVTFIGNGNVSPTSTTPKGGGGGSKGTKPKKVNKNDVVDRYKEIDDQLDNVKDAYEDASKEADRLYGASRISAMKRANNEIQKEIGLLEKKKEEAQKYLKLDKEALELAAKQAGVQLEFQDNEIVNYTAVLEQLYNQLKALIDAAGETVDEAEQEAIDKLQEKIDELKSAIKTFDDTKELIEDTDNDIKDKNYEWQDNNYEELSYKLELEIDINDAELQKLEYFLNKYSDNFYKMAESAALMNDKIDPTIQNLEEYKNHKEALDESYRNGEISQEAYIEGLKEVREGYYNNLEALIELDKQMAHYLEDTLSAAAGEVAEFTDHMEHLTGVFDHYMNLMEIFGKQKDYDAMGNFLSGKADTLRDRLDVAKEYYEMLKENNKVDEYWSNYQSALAAGDEDKARWWKEQWDAEVDALDAAQEEMLGLTEEWAESMKAVVENNMAKAADALEKSLTNGFGFDYLMDQWDKMNTQQEEYLDKTNQIYETNKMMRTAQKALDETTNKVAKQKLKNFIEETARLQENTKLSKHELEIRQAQYDLLLAEIALEDAQNAKSTVRLSRDSEGNFGYIYTADEDKINEAEQNLDDKRNDIYNLSLEGQKEYMDKYLQASKEMYDELNELQAQYLEGLLTEEEFKLRSEAIKKYYLGSSEFQKAMADLEEEYRKGNLGSEEEYNRLRQEIIRKYSAQDIGILNQYLDIANTSNRIAREEDAKLQQKYQDENIISQEEYYKKKAEMIKSFNENMATLDKAYYEDGALTEAEYNQLRENLTNKFHNDMKELNKTYYQDGIENENKFNQEKEALTNKYHADIKALNDAFYIDGTISEEEYNNERNALTKKYHDDINALTKDYYKTGLEDDKNYNKEKAELIDTFANDSKGVLGDFFDFYLDKTESTGDNASESWGDNLGNMTHNTSDWSDDVNDYLDEVEEGAEDMRDVYEEVNEDLEDALENSAEATEDLKDESDDLRKEIKNKVIPAIKDEIDEVKKLTTKYGLQKDELDKLIDTYEDYLDLIGEKIEYHSIETEEPEIQIPKEEQTETPSAEEKPVNNSEAKKIAKEAQEIINKVHYGKDGMTEGNNGWAPNARKKGYSEEAIAIAKKAFNDSKDGSGYSYFYEEALKLAGQYNTGGYTGAWGPEGKLAFLHEKELILNKDDTENILNTVSFIRDIVSMIDNKANMSSLFSMSAMAGITSGNMGMEQQVTIYAEFPDATDHNEIEQAFNSLLNTASQYANRK